MIGIVVGTKAEMIRCSYLVHLLQAKGVEFCLIFTGQNLIDLRLLKALGISSIQNLIQLKIMTNLGLDPIRPLIKSRVFLSHYLRKIFAERKISRVVYQGDTLSTLGAAEASRVAGLRSYHIEAGFRTYSLEPYPEEYIRRRVDAISGTLFAPSRTALFNLFREKVRGKVILTGSTIFDVIAFMRKLNLSVRYEDFALLTYHRQENIYNPFRLKRCTDIIQLLNALEIPCFFVTHPATEYMLKMYGMSRTLHKLSNVRLIHYLSYEKFLPLLARCRFVITDSGSIEEESMLLGKRCLILRKRTERIEAIRNNNNVLCNFNIDVAKSFLREVLDQPVPMNVTYPYYFGRSPSEMICEYIVKDD